MPLRRTVLSVAVCALCAAGLLPGPVRAEGDCAAPAAGGEWRSYGHDLSNTRNQDAEEAISAADVASLEPAWTFSLVPAGVSGSFQSTPVVADGCVFVTTNTGEVVALNADTGAAPGPRTSATCPEGSAACSRRPSRTASSTST